MKLSETFKKYIWEIVTFILFCVSTITLSFFHEPWFDEFQAWGIAKDSIYNILFVIPHYESHPPLWHLIIKFFQQFTTNPELAIKIPNLMIMFTAVWLLIFKSPFPKKIRLVLPFTFFIFYQYTIVSRPYCLLVLGMFLAAVLYKSKNDHPFRFISSLILLSLSSAYGVVLATGITLAWVVEIWNRQNFKVFLLDFLKDKRFFAMLILFFVCLGITIHCIPYNDSHINSCLTTIPLWQKIIYFAFGLTADATAFNIFNYNNSWSDSILTTSYIAGCLFGACILYLMVKIFQRNGKISLFLLTFLPISIFFFMYIWPHHIGILYITFIFLIWCLYATTNFAHETIPNYTKVILLFIFIIQVYWSCCSTYREVVRDYAFSRQVANYIKENRLTRFKIISPWGERIKIVNEKGEEYPIHFLTGTSYQVDGYKTEIHRNTERQWLAVMVNPYFGKNIFYTFNVDNPNILYNTHLPQTLEEGEKQFRKWEKLGKPDIVIGKVQVWNIWKDYFPEFISIQNFKSGFVWKDVYSTNEIDVYVDASRLKELNIVKTDNAQ